MGEGELEEKEGSEQEEEDSEEQEGSEELGFIYLKQGQYKLINIYL